MISKEETKQCTSCGETKPLSEFHKSKSNKDGLVYWCKHCVKTYGSRNYEERRAFKKTRSKELEDAREERREYSVWQGIKGRAKKKGLGFDLKVADIDPPEFCPVFGFRLKRGKGSPQKNSPSVDRIDPSKGYTKDNIQVISNLANVMKQDATPEQLLMFADWIYKTYK